VELIEVNAKLKELENVEKTFERNGNLKYIIYYKKFV
jgi:hypothetical protein